MPVDPSIIGRVQTPDVFGMMQQAQDSAIQNDARKLQMQTQRAAAEAAARKAQEQQAAQAVIQKYGGDIKGALKELYTVAPTFAVELEKNYSAARKEAELATEAEMKTAKAKRELWHQRLKIVEPGNEAQYQSYRQAAIADDPEAEQMLPPQWDAAAIDRVHKSFLSEAANEKRNEQAFERFKNGDYMRGTALAKSAATTPEEWEEAGNVGMEYGATPEQVASFGPFSPAAVQRARMWTMTPKEQEAERRADATLAGTQEDRARDDARQAGTAAEAARHNRVMEARAAQGGGGAGFTLSPGQTRFGADGKPIATAAPSAGGAGGVKLAAATVEKIAGIDQSLGVLDTMEGLLNEDWIGPVAGRASQFRADMPGVSIDSKLAQFMAETATLKNAVVKATTGAAMSEPEAQRIMEQIPLLTDKPERWRAKAASTRKNLSLMKRRTLELSGGGGELAPEDAATEGGPAAAPVTHRFNPKTGKFEKVGG